jgi:hypothetical protein
LSVPDQVRGVERTALVACLAMAVVAALIPQGGWQAGVGVLGGGVLAAVSYRGLKSAVFSLNSGRNGGAAALVKFFTRHAILALAAYAMLARLRLPAWAIAAGASSLVVAVAIVAARSVGSVSRPGNPR